MSTLLRIDSSPLGSGASFSRELTTQFIELWKPAHRGGRVIERDLGTTLLPQVTAEWITAAYTPERQLTLQQRQILTTSDELISELQNAGEYVIGVPMHNFSIPSGLKLWIDQIVRVGKTFAYENGAPVGLLRDKKATFIVASGGKYDSAERAAANFVEPYLRWMFGFIRVTDVTFINAGGTAGVRYGVDREAILQPARAAVQAQFQAA
jgi:FMN-dependent NADH-azoreductase